MDINTRRAPIIRATYPDQRHFTEGDTRGIIDARSGSLTRISVHRFRGWNTAAIEITNAGSFSTTIRLTAVDLRRLASDLLDAAENVEWESQGADVCNVTALQVGGPL